jgi:hypothetical protein
MVEHDFCYGCKEYQEQPVVFRAKHPFSTESFMIEYCAAFRVILDENTKNMAFNCGCKERK